MTFSDRFLQYYIDIAERTAQMSYSKRLLVGSVIVVDNGIISTGYNGRERGADNNCEYVVNGELVTKSDVIHAEDNAIRRVYERNLCAHGGAIFVTHFCCKLCAEKIVAAGISEVYYKHDYRDNGGEQVLNDNGIIIRRVC